MTAPGDMKNNLKILQSEVRYMKYPEEIDLPAITKGKPQAFLPLYSHAFNSFSPEFTAEVVQLLDESLFGKSDLRFMEAVYRVLRDLFNYKPSITKDQFFSTAGFAERKVMMCADVLKLIRERVRRLAPPKETNPNIKVHALIDNRRTSRGSSKQSLDNLVTLEPANDTAISRKLKISPRPVTAPNSTHSGFGKSLSPGMGGDDKRRPGSYRAHSPISVPHSSTAVEVVTMSGRRSPDSARLADMRAKSPDRSISQTPSPRDHTDAMETILSKVRDLPSQLANFMQAVESRLQKVEARLEQVEEAAKEKTTVGVDEMGHTKQEELKQQMETLRSRLVLLENRVTLAESNSRSNPTENKTPNKDMRDLPKMEATSPSSPFVTLERGGGVALSNVKKDFKDDSFAASLVKNFSPIRREGLVFGNDTLSNLSDYNPRRSSTPTHPQKNGCHDAGRVANGTEEEEKMGVGEPPSELSVSFQNMGLDMSTQKQVDRIKDMLQSTKQLLPVNPSDNLTSK